MKSYILLPSEPVQSQITTVAARTQASVLFVGLDVHNESIAVSLAPSDTAEVRRYQKQFGGGEAEVAADWPSGFETV